jgi:heme/copper-type cytochrome/quinol oxidase subunit 4
MSTESGSMKNDLAVYVVILALAGLQIFMAYHTTGSPVIRMLVVAAIQAYLAVMFFMHLRNEKSTLRLALIPGTLFVLIMMNMVWADSFRLIHLKPFAK